MSTSTAPQATASASAEPRTIWEYIAGAIARYSDAPALALRDADPEVRWSFRDLGQQVENAARHLAARGITRGDRVLLWGSNRPQWAATFLALVRLGAVIVPLDYRSAPDFIQRVADKTRPKAVVLDRALSAGFEPELAPRTFVDDLFAEPPSGDEPLPPHEGGPADLVEIVFTSGTTGEPKGVMVTHGNLLANVRGVGKVLEIHPWFRLVSLLPLSHLFEQIALIVATGSGASTVYLQTLRPDRIIEAIKEERSTCMVCVPQVLDLFLTGIEREVRRAGKEKQYELLHRIARRLPFGLRKHLFKRLHARFGGRFEFFAVGGAALDPELGRRWEDMGIKVLQGYGTTEAAPVVSLTHLSDRAMGTVGWPIEGLELKIADDGEIWIRGPQVTPGYFENEEATGTAFEDGWYKTGDLGELDERRCLRIKGRKKNMIVLANGLNVYPEDVESALRLSPSVKDAVVLGLKRGRSDIDVHAVLVMHEADQAEAAVKAANRRLAPHQQIRGHTLWPDEDFPRTLTMKPRRPVISERLKELGVGETV